MAESESAPRVIERNLSERYRLEGRIGQGGMAIVYAGVDSVLRRRVAIKVLRDDLAADADFVARFYTEAQHAARLSHPNIVNIYDVGREGESYFIVMELVEGATLAEMIRNGERLPEAVAIDFAIQICVGLAYAHRQGILHRDVKPANILVTKDDVVKLSDFGIARAVTSQTVSVTMPGMVMGSVHFMSPEQAQGNETQVASDLYSLGIVLYVMLTGKLPYTGDSPVTVALKHVSAPVPAVDAEDPAIGAAISAIVSRLMQKDPAARFASALDVSKALREARERPNAEAPFDRPPGSVPRPVLPPLKPRPSKFPDRAPGAARADESETPASRGIPRLAAVALALCALAIAIVAGYYSNIANAVGGKPGTIVVASVVGATLDDAERRLAASGLKYSIASVSSDRVAADRVVRQDPSANARVAPGTIVTITASTGLPVVQLIDIRRYSRDDAERYLRDAKLVPKVVGRYDRSPSGTVLDQKPAAGASIPIRSKVVLVVSKGLQPVAVPDIASETLDDATKELRGRGLGVTVAERDQSDQIPAGVVMAQSPAAGADVDPGSSVQVTVSAGPPQLRVPGVAGKTASDAANALAAVGLRTTTEYVVDSSADAGTVLKQDPAPDVQAKKGASVTLSVAAPGVVPDVSGKSPAVAQTMLENAGYKVGNLAYVQEGTEGTVARTEPAASTALPPGETVMMFVSGVSPSGQ